MFWPPVAEGVDIVKPQLCHPCGAHPDLGLSYQTLQLDQFSVYIFLEKVHLINIPTKLSLLKCEWFQFFDYYKLCCSEHWGASVFLNYSFLQIHAHHWGSWIIW